VKLAIDSYCYHRYYGDVYAGLQKLPATTMTVWDFLKRAKRLGVAGVSLESCYFPSLPDDLLKRLRDTLDAYEFESVWAWGHPSGLCSGTNREAARDLVCHIGYAKKLGARVMRIVGGSWRNRPTSWAIHKRRLASMLKKLLPAAEDHGIVLAIENHVDMTADQIVELITTIDSPWLRVCLDTGNNVRLHEDPVMVAEKLAPFTRATHIKDVWGEPGAPKDFASWPSVPLGKGVVNIPKVLEHLRKARYRGLLAIEIDYLRPDYGDEGPAVRASVKYLKSLLASKSLKHH